MLQNKIYQNFFIEIIKTFFIVLFALSIISLTVRAVNFLDLIVENGYPVTTYFKYSILNLFGIAPKFIPLSFLISIIVFTLKHIDEGEFVILWTAGEKKTQIVHLLLLTSFFVSFIYLMFSAFLTPSALNKSRQLLSEDNFNSFLPTVKPQQFNDTFKGFTFFVEKKINNEIKNIFLHDQGRNLKNLSSNSTNLSSTTITAEKGISKGRSLFLINGQIISSKNNSSKNEVIKFEQLNLNLDNLKTTTIKIPKIQETSTIKLVQCFLPNNLNLKFCNVEAKKEVLTTLIRRIILPFYIPLISLICFFLLISNTKFFSNKITIFIYCFLVLLFTELVIRYTGINYAIRIIYIFTPFVLLFCIYFFLIFKFSKKIGVNE